MKLTEALTLFMYAAAITALVGMACVMAYECVRTVPEAVLGPEPVQRSEVQR